MGATTFLALLRGINVGGKNKLAMKALSELFVDVGCGNVRTFIQSGNVIFTANPSDSALIPGLIAAQIAKSFDLRVPVLLRTAEHLEKVVANNPFFEAGAAEESLHVLFLAEPPSLSRVETLDPDRSPPDAFIVRGPEIYLQLPNGMARTKLSNTYFDSKLATISTARNWRTVTKLLNLMNG